jgi:hypothetical protein
MEINRHNYEAYAIDFIEGKMSPSVAAAFIAFLTDNPDIAQEVELLRDFDTDTNMPPVHQDFSFLKKDYNNIKLDSNNFEELCIAYHEGDLNENTQKSLIEFIHNNKKRQEIFNTYKQLKIVPDQRIAFGSKGSLKQKNAVWLNSRRIALISTMAAAASFAMVFIFRINNSIEPKNPGIAQPSSTKIEQVEKYTPESIKSQVVVQQPVEKAVTQKQDNNRVIHSKQIEEYSPASIAAVSDSADSEVIRLARIEPKPIQVENKTEIQTLLLSKQIVMKKTAKEEQNAIEELRDKTNILVTRASQLSVNSVIKSGINGLNNIAETDLSYKSQTDDKGRITIFALSSESFNIKRRIRNN